MALTASIACLLLSLLVAVTPVTSMATASSSLIQCYDPVTNATINDTDSFRASLLPLLTALPSAAAPTGFAALRSKSDSAFARGLCFAEWNGTLPADCLSCLSIAARNLASGCGTTTRRAGIWTGRCFVAYANTDASSPAEDAFRSRVLLRGSDGAVTDADPLTYRLHDMLVSVAQDVALSAAANISGPRMLGIADSTVWRTVHVLAQCARDRTAAECARCLQQSARAMDWDLDADRRDGGVAAAVVGFNCYLCFDVSPSLEPQETAFTFQIVIRVLGALLFVAVVLYAQFAYHRIIANGKKKKTTEDKMDARQRP